MRFPILIFLCILTLRAQLIQERNAYEWQVPRKIKQCALSLATQAVSSIKLDLTVNPYYLRGDFDGDGLMDLAIALRGATDDTKSATGICPGKGSAVLLGSLAKGHIINNDIAESVPSAGWAVVSRGELLQILRLSRPPQQRVYGLRKKFVQGKGEIIYVPYEDGEGAILYVNGHFEWYTVNSVLFPQDIPNP